MTSADTVDGYISSNSTDSYSNGILTVNVTNVIQHFDDKLGEFVATLKAQGTWKETLLIIGSKQGFVIISYFLKILAADTLALAQFSLP